MCLCACPASCGGRLTGPSGYIVHPNNPDNSQHFIDCTWLVVGPDGHYLTFTFTEFQIQSSPLCSNVYMEVRERNESGRLEVSQKKRLCVTSRCVAWCCFAVGVYMSSHIICLVALFFGFFRFTCGCCRTCSTPVIKFAWWLQLNVLLLLDWFCKWPLHFHIYLVMSGWCCDGRGKPMFGSIPNE